ncbi:MAG: ABC transporter substrate-binding protein [Rhodospirillaceae bacterium]|nr:ABC transporter substrate-binding protein [Rhodospirillaceae bacterium]
MLKNVVRAAAVAAIGLTAAAAQAQDKVRVSFNPQIYSWLPFFLAIDKGYFKAEKLDVEYTMYGGSALSQIPMLARGDQDIAGMVTGPGFFNQYAGGFGVKLIASNAQGKKGWNDTTWLMVRKDIWDSGKIKTFADMKGLKLEGGPKGSPVYLTTTQAMQQGGLTMKDVVFTERLRAVTDALPIFRNKAADVLSIVEPIVTRLETEGLAVRWKASYEVMPWFQESYLAANPKFLAEKRDVAKRFLRAYEKACQDITATNGKWTPETLNAVVKWSKFPKEVIEKIAGPQHVGQYGKIDTASIQRQQDIWIAAGMVKEKTPLDKMVDTSIIDEVRKEMKLP